MIEKGPDRPLSYFENMIDVYLRYLRNWIEL